MVKTISDKFINGFEIFHKSLTNLQAHPITYVLDIYKGCKHQCCYCMYNNINSDVKPIISKKSLTNLQHFLNEAPNKFITGIGNTSDCYQPIERKLGITRAALEIFNSRNFPVLLLTRSPLVLRDSDILIEMGKKGLVEVSSTLITLNPREKMMFENKSPSIKTRLDTIKKLSYQGISVSFHFTPYIPALHKKEDLENLFNSMKDVGVKRIYFTLLGLTAENKKRIIAAAESLRTGLGTEIISAYSKNYINKFSNISPNFFLSEHKKIFDLCEKLNLKLFSENFPVFSSENGFNEIYRYKIPVLPDFLSYAEHHNLKHISWKDMKSFFNEFPYVSERHRAFIKKHWIQGSLFKNTYFHLNNNFSTDVDYVKKEELNMGSLFALPGNYQHQR